MKRLIVIGLENACTVIDRTWSWPRPLRIAALIGCPRGLALLSSRLDERWQTDVWEIPTD